MIDLSREFLGQLHTPSQIWLLLRIAVSFQVLRLLRHALSTQKLVRLAMPRSAARRLPPETVISALSLLSKTRLLSSAGECLPRSLVCYRYLSQASLEPTLLVGFNGSAGHAWVELDGDPFLEPLSNHPSFQPLLILPPGSNSLQKASNEHSKTG